ncbi:MAG: PDZ domain-containing protein [Vicinamibacterales bacterium]
MKRHRTVVITGLLATAVAVAVAGLAARTGDGQTWSTRGERTDQPDGRRGTGVFIAGDGERQVFALDGRGSQLGVMVSDADEAGARGVRVDEVQEDSAAARAGVKEGDVVLEFDGEQVRSARQFSRLVQETPSGRSVQMTVRRGTARQTFDITPQNAEFGWTARLGPQIREELERSLPRLRELPELAGPAFNFRFDGRPALGGRARLGVQVETLGDQLADYFGATSGGVLVASVTDDSPAVRAGVKAGDVITTVNGTSVRDARGLMDALAAAPESGEVTLDIIRDRKPVTLKATIDRPASEQRRRSRRPA